MSRSVEVYEGWSTVHTDKTENKIFLVCKEFQSGAVAKSYMTNGLLIYDFATAPLCISLYMRKILFYFFISAYTVELLSPLRGMEWKWSSMSGAHGITLQVYYMLPRPPV